MDGGVLAGERGSYHAAMSTKIHPTAVIDPACEIGEGCDIGPFCVLTGKVVLGENVRLVSHVTMQGPVTVGNGSIFYPGSAIGFPPQDLKFKLGHATAGVVIGADNMIREGVTIHASTKPDIPTRTGDRCFLMALSHMGHDACIGNDVTMVNAVLLAGHVKVADKVTLGGNAAVHQFCRIGRLAFVGGLVAMSMDVPPFCISGARNTIHGLNVVGLRRNGVDRKDITNLRRAFRDVFRARLPRPEMVALLKEIAKESPIVNEWVEFVEATGTRSIAAASGGDNDDDRD